MATNGSTINRNGVNHSNNDQSQTIATTTTTTIPSTTSIEDLYKYFGILADAKDQAGKVIIYFVVVENITPNSLRSDSLIIRKLRVLIEII